MRHRRIAPLLPLLLATFATADSTKEPAPATATASTSTTAPEPAAAAPSTSTKAPPATKASAPASVTTAPAPSTSTAAPAPSGKKSHPAFWEKYLTNDLPLDVAIHDTAKRLAENPKSASLHNDMGNLLARRGFPKEALAEYSEASKLDKQFFLADYNAGLIYEEQRKTEHAINAYLRSIKRKPGFPPAHFHLGLMYERQGKDDQAVEQYAQALRIDPSMRLPSRNPLIVQTRLLYRISLANYSYDIATADLATEQAFVQPEQYKKIQVERPVSAQEVEAAEAEEEPVPQGPAGYVASASAPPSATIPASTAPMAPAGKGGRPAPTTRPPGSPFVRPAPAPPPPSTGSNPVMFGPVVTPAPPAQPPPPPQPAPEPPPSGENPPL
jgi:hypothetical protein